MIRQGLDKRPWCDARDALIVRQVEQARELENLVRTLRTEIAALRARRGDANRTA